MNANMSVARAMRHLLSGPYSRAPAQWGRHVSMFNRAHLIVTAFYILSAAQLYSYARSLTVMPSDGGSLDLLWPVAWMAFVPFETATIALANLFVIVGLLAVFLWRFRIVRILVFLCMLQYGALSNSHGSISHGFHEWIWVSFCFCFLPGQTRAEIEQDRVLRTDFLYSFSLAPFLILLFYTMSGAIKVWVATLSLIHGYASAFWLEGMALVIARRAVETGSAPIWAEPILQFPALGWPLFMGLYFIELVSVVVFFRPVLHRFWGVILIAFHFGTLTFLDIVFPTHVIINGLLFVMSPFAPAKEDWREVLAAIPIIGGLFRYAFGGRATEAPVQ